MQAHAQVGRLSLREERAEVTRRRIAMAALALFERDGYGATTMRAIAKEAGVAVQTVYAVYRSKAGILDALTQGVIHDPAADTLFGAVMKEPAAARRLALFARSIRRRWENGAAIVGIHRDAAVTDPAIRAGVGRTLARRRAGLATLASALEPDLTGGITASKAAAILDALTMPEMWTELIGVHGWTPDEYERWLRGALAQQLLGTPDETDEPDGSGALAALEGLQAPTADLDQMLTEIDAGRDG